MDSKISNAYSKTHVFLRVLKETAVRPIEGWRVRWIDVDAANRTISITPAKFSKARKMRITEQTMNLLYSLPRNNEYILFR